MMQDRMRELIAGLAGPDWPIYLRDVSAELAPNCLGWFLPGWLAAEPPCTLKSFEKRRPVDAADAVLALPADVGVLLVRLLKPQGQLGAGAVLLSVLSETSPDSRKLLVGSCVGALPGGRELCWNKWLADAAQIAFSTVVFRVAQASSCRGDCGLG
jgi:hypothetical protein